MGDPSRGSLDPEDPAMTRTETATAVEDSIGRASAPIAGTSNGSCAQMKMRISSLLAGQTGRSVDEVAEQRNLQRRYVRCGRKKQIVELFWSTRCQICLSCSPFGYLDEQFTQLEELQDETSPNFVEEVVVLFFKDSSRLLANIDQTLDKYPQDFYRLDSLVHTLKGRGTSIGAMRLKNECSVLKAHCNNKNLEGSLQKMKREHATLKQKLETYCQFSPICYVLRRQMMRQVGPANVR
ncbi:hypothetical protein PR202_ga11495 [Eleusine coracana subsp. coracana]|uniref:Histidine-containing phosphotransfer protein n=1 Tax=Eleusine coracana subsp. coracana TaxID=191504 RepID=A0AAV5C9L8_ELECO|nr:hypothetical protein PR202_ga11495 [Eleusine coracana subsp. coracana]